MTDSPEATPTTTTNESLGVIGAQQAAEEARRNADTPAPPGATAPVTGANLRREALQLAIQGGADTPEGVVERATAYEKYLRGASND